MDCTFCEEQNKYHENEFFYARWNDKPISPGHSLVVPKKHITSMFDMTKEEWSSLDDIIKETIEIIGTTNLKDLYIISIRSENDNTFDNKYRFNMLSKIGMGMTPINYGVKFREGECVRRNIEHFVIEVVPGFEGYDCNPSECVINALAFSNNGNGHQKPIENLSRPYILD